MVQKSACQSIANCLTSSLFFWYLVITAPPPIQNGPFPGRQCVALSGYLQYKKTFQPAADHNQPPYIKPVPLTGYKPGIFRNGDNLRRISPTALKRFLTCCSSVLVISSTALKQPKQIRRTGQNNTIFASYFIPNQAAIHAINTPANSDFFIPFRQRVRVNRC